MEGYYPRDRKTFAGNSGDHYMNKRFAVNPAYRQKSPL